MRSAIALAINDPPWTRGIAEAPIRRYPIERWRRPYSLAITHLIKPQILRVLQKRHKGFLQKRQGAVSGAIAVLHPPCIPSRPLYQPIPVRHVEHRQILEHEVGREHSTSNIQQAQILGVANAAVELAFELPLPRPCPQAKQWHTYSGAEESPHFFGEGSRAHGRSHVETDTRFQPSRKAC